jgi:hypothetical protein
LNPEPEEGGRKMQRIYLAANPNGGGGAKPNGADAGQVLPPVIGHLLDFLDKHFGDFSPIVQNLIAVVFTLSVAIVSLNLILAPVIVKGKLYRIEAGNPAKNFVKFSQIGCAGEETWTDAYGSFKLIIPLSFPKHVKILIYDPNGPSVLGEGSLFLFPIWNGIFAKDQVECRIEMDQNNKYKIVIARKQKLQSLMETAFSWLAIPRAAVAQPVTNPPLGNLSVASSAPPAVAPACNPPTVKLSIQSIKVEKYPAYFSDSGPIYFTITQDGKQIQDMKLIYGQSPVKTNKPKYMTAQNALPVKSVRESWVQVQEGNAIHYNGLSTELPLPNLQAGMTAGTKQSSYIVILQMWSPNNELLGSFVLDLKPNEVVLACKRNDASLYLQDPLKNSAVEVLLQYLNPAPDISKPAEASTPNSSPSTPAPLPSPAP